MPELETPEAPSTASTTAPANAGQAPVSSSRQVATPPAGMDMLGIKKTSVNTTEAETNDLSQHLQQVYTPREKDIVQHQEEDRMPTILFDDDLAKQLEHQFLEEHPQQSAPKKDDSSEDDSIQLSK